MQNTFSFELFLFSCCWVTPISVSCQPGPNSVIQTPCPSCLMQSGQKCWPLIYCRSHLLIWGAECTLEDHSFHNRHTAQWNAPCKELCAAGPLCTAGIPCRTGATCVCPAPVGSAAGEETWTSRTGKRNSSNRIHFSLSTSFLHKRRILQAAVPPLGTLQPQHFERKLNGGRDYY